MVSILCPSLHHRRVYSDGVEREMLDVMVESLRKTADPDEYELVIADNPAESWRVAMNRMIRETKTDVIICDDDHIFLDPGWIGKYVEWGERIQNGGVFVARTWFATFDPPPCSEGAVEVDSFSRGCLQSAGTGLTNLCWSKFEHYGSPDPGCYEYPRTVTYCCSGGAFYKRAFLDEMGEIPESFEGGCHFEDVWISLRCWQLGGECWYVPDPKGPIHASGPTKANTGQNTAERGNHNRLALIDYFGEEFIHHVRRMTDAVVPH